MELEMLSFGRFVLCSIDIYMIYFFFKSMFSMRENMRLRLVYGFIAAASIFLINAFQNTVLNLMFVPIACFLYVLVGFKITFTQGIAYTIIYYAIFAGGREVAYELLFRLLSTFLPYEIPKWFTNGGFYFLIPEYLLSFLFLLIIGRSTRKLEIREEQEFAWYLLIMPVVSVFVLSSYLYIDFPESIYVQRLMCIGAFMLYFSNAAVFIILAKYTNILNTMKYEEMYMMKQAMEDEKFKNIVRLNERYRAYMHDIHSYLRHFRILIINGQQDKIVGIIDELEGKVEIETRDIVYSGNEVLNAILSEYKIKSQNQGIDMSVFVENFLKVDFIADTDMIAMFGNLLNNALEAAGKCESGHRKVDVKLFMGNQFMLVLHIENTFTVSAPREGERFLTTKKDVCCHGLGIGIVKKLAEKYGGDLTLEEKGDTFKASLIISSCPED